MPKNVKYSLIKHFVSIQHIWGLRMQVINSSGRVYPAPKIIKVLLNQSCYNLGRI